MIVWTYEGLKWWLRTALHGDNRNTQVHLYKNNHTPTVDSVDADFTECDFAGYFSVIGPDWLTPTTGAGKATNLANPVEFGTGVNAEPGQDIYGWYMTDNDGHVVCAERFSDAPRHVAGESSTCTVYPQIYSTNSA